MFFDDILIARMRAEEREQIEEIVNANEDIYSSVGHFARCACIKLIEAHKKKWKKNDGNEQEEV